ncbi:MAG: DUF885 domain-containing protein [Anaerolineales bacterium]
MKQKWIFFLCLCLIIILSACNPATLPEATSIEQQASSTASPTEVDTATPTLLAPTSTATSLPPTSTPTLTPEPVYEPPSIDEILGSLAGLSIDTFFEESYRQLRLRDPDILYAGGFGDAFGVVLTDQFTDLSLPYLLDTQELERSLFEMLHTYDRDTLSAEQRISYDALDWYLDSRVMGQDFMDYKFLVNPVWGLQQLPIDFLLEYAIENEQDAGFYIDRIASLETWGDQVIAGLQRNEAVGALPPRYVLEDTVAQIDGILMMQSGDYMDGTLIEVYRDFMKKVNELDDLGDEDKENLLDKAQVAVEESFIPAYLAIKDQLLSMIDGAIEDPNQWVLPGGAAYYNYLLAYYTGTDLTADELHAMALAEVDHIKREMREVMSALGYPADISMPELNQRINEDSPVLNGLERRDLYEAILAAADQAADDYFDLRSSADVEIQWVKSGPPAYYVLPKPDSDEPGIMPVNQSVSPLLYNYNEFVLTHHETIPGHHTQLSLAQELDLPPFQRFYCVNPALQDYALQAYAEGWAWYAENLAYEMGLYAGQPLANLGRLRLHLFRAVRMVVDTGLHARGWTLDQAADYLEQETGIPQEYAQLTRYLVNPGYPSGYSVGFITLNDLRQRAEAQLGKAFDIKQFHNVVLGSGVLPISVLEEVVEDWIAVKLTE